MLVHAFVESVAHSSFTSLRVFAWALLFLGIHRVTIHKLQDVIQPPAVNRMSSHSVI
jgi:hypothetical protein